MAKIKPETTKGHDLGDSSYKWGTVHTGDVQTETLTTSGNLVVGGTLTVTGSNIVAEVTTIAAEDPLISLAKDNTGDVFDIGFYGKAVNGSSETDYHGFVRAASDGKFKIFKNASAEPTTTVGSHSVATLVADLEVPSGSTLKVPEADGTLTDYITAVTLGTATANKVLTVDGSKDLTGISTLTAGTLSAGNVTIAGNDITVSGGSPSFSSVDINGGAIDGTTIGITTPSSAKVTTLNATGATTLDGAVTLGNATSDDITVTGYLASSVVPKVDGTHDLGTTALRMRHVYSDNITATTINGFTAGGNIDFNNVNMTDVDIDSGDISGTDITVGAGKTLDVSAGTITFAADQVTNANLATINTADKVSLDALDIDGAAEMGAAIVDADLLIIDDGADGTEKSMLASRIPTYVKSKLSGGTGVTHTDGAFSIGQAVATTSDVTFNTVTASTFTGKVTDISNHDTDDLTEGSNLYFTNERVDDRVNTLITDGQAIGSTYDDTANTLTIAVDTATTADLGVASFATADFSVSGGAVTIKADGISNAQITNPAMFIAGATVNLGDVLTAASIATAIDGEPMALTSVTDLDGAAGNLTIFDTLNNSGTLTVGHADGIIAIPGDLDLTGDMKDDLNLVATKKYQINGTDVLTNTTLGSGVVTSSLTSVGALASGSIASGFGAIATASNISTTQVVDLASDADADDYSADSATGRLTLGTSDDLSLYHGGANSYIVNKVGELRLDAPASSEISLSIAGTEEAHIDADGIDLASDNDYKINDVSVLSATTLGSSVVNSSVTAVGALNSGSITSGFTSIDVGSGAITTSGTLTGGILAVDNVQINGSNIGHTNDTDLLTVASGTLTVAGRVDLTTLAIGSTDITADATELNYVDGVTSSIQTQINAKAPVANPIFTGVISIGSVSVDATELAILDGATLDTTELNHVDGVTSAIQTQLDNKQTENAQLTTLTSLAAAVATELVALADGEIEVLDGATVGSAAINKALVVDGSRDIDNLGTVTATKFELTGASANNYWNSANGLQVDSIILSGGNVKTSTGDLTLNAESDNIVCHANDSFQVTAGLLTAGYRQKVVRSLTASTNLQGDSALSTTHVITMTSSSATTVDLPNPDELTEGRELVVKNLGAGNLTVEVADDTNIDGAATKVLTQYQSATFLLINELWYTI